MRKRFVVLFPLILTLTACASTPKQNPSQFKTAPLFGMIYDYDNNACEGVTVSVDGKSSVASDIDGRFVLPNLSRGKHTIVAKKYDFETLTVKIDFLNFSQVLYLKMVSFHQLLDRARKALARGRFATANAFLERAGRIHAINAELSYLRAILAFKREDYARAAKTLQASLAAGNDDPYVYLFLADLYQYHLAKPALAIHALKDYLRLNSDPKVQNRLEALTAAKK